MRKVPKQINSSGCPYIDYYKTNHQNREMYSNYLNSSDPYLNITIPQEMGENNMLPNQMGNVENQLMEEELMEQGIMPGMAEEMELPVMPMNFDFAKAYVPIQYYQTTFSPDEALRAGTIFPELFQPKFYIKPIPGSQY